MPKRKSSSRSGRRYKKRRYSKKSSGKGYLKKAVARVVKSMSETKYLMGTSGNVGMLDNAWYFTNIPNWLPNGTGAHARIGEKVFAKGIAVKLNIIENTANTSSDTIFLKFYWIRSTDFTSNGITGPTWSVYSGNFGSQVGANLTNCFVNTDRIKVLQSFSIKIPPAPFNDLQRWKQKQLWLPINRTLTYNDGSGQLKNGNYYLIGAVQNLGGNGGFADVNLQFDFKMYFKDV